PGPHLRGAVRHLVQADIRAGAGQDWNSEVLCRRHSSHGEAVGHHQPYGERLIRLSPESDGEVAHDKVGASGQQESLKPARALGLQLNAAHEIDQDKAVRGYGRPDFQGVNGMLGQCYGLLIQASWQQKPTRMVSSVVKRDVEEQRLKRRLLQALTA